MKKGDPLPPRLMEYCRQNGRMMEFGADREDSEDFTPSSGDNSGQPQVLCTPPQRNRDEEQQQVVVNIMVGSLIMDPFLAQTSSSARRSQSRQPGAAAKWNFPQKAATEGNRRQA
jgi:hypothetical protein